MVSPYLMKVILWDQRRVRISFMGVMSGILVFVMVWMVVLFMVLPWNVDVPKQIQEGHASSAPQNSYIPQKLLITTLIAGLLWFGVDCIISSDYFSFRAN